MSKRTRSALCWLVFFPAIAAPVWAQHTELATNGDGSVLYIVSYSVLRGTTTLTGTETRLYRLTSDGVELFGQRESPSTMFSTSSDGVYSVQVSDDGRTVG